MFQQSLTGGKSERVKRDKEPRYYAEGDEIFPATPVTESLRNMAIVNENGRWYFNLAIDLSNPTDTHYRLELSGLVLQDGTYVDPKDESSEITLDPGTSGTLNVNVPIPSGTTPRLLKMNTKLTKNDETEERTREVPLSSVPVRRTDS